MTLRAPSLPLSPRVRNTDWDEYAAVDLVDFLPATTTRFEDDLLHTEVYRYRDTAPPPSVYENGEREYRVTRITRPLVEHLTAKAEHPTAEAEHLTADAEHPTAEAKRPTADAEHPTAEAERFTTDATE
ncbi:hypothetical protein [Salinigranum rubrum]|uniref:hypothetical protein n=1 Tax=Salinigranum rubrum TaxID=755307 RepID=UPI0013A58C4D